MSNPRYCHSLDGENFEGDYESREQALAYGQQDAYNNHNPGEQVTVYTGVVQSAAEVLRKYAERMGESAIDCAEDYASLDIAADDIIVDVPNDKHAELGRVIVDWLAANATFNRWGVKDIQEHPYTTPPEGGDA
jgi:hypothetical protein